MASRTRAPAPTSASSRRGSASHRTAVRADPHAGRPRQGTRRGGRRRRGVARAEAPVVNRDQAIATRPGGAPLGRADAAAAPGPPGPVDDHLPDAQACSTSRPRSGGEEELRPGVSRLPSTSRTGSVRRVPREGQHPAVRSTPDGEVARRCSSFAGNPATHSGEYSIPDHSTEQRGPSAEASPS